MTRIDGVDGATDVYVVGIGWHRYQRESETSFVDLGNTAVRAALADAGVDWTVVQSAYIGTARLGMAVGRPMLRHLGVTGIPMTQVENASASGSSAFRLAVKDVAAGYADLALAVGVDKPPSGPRAEDRTGVRSPAGNLVFPAAHYGLLSEEYLRGSGTGPEALAHVAVKNHRNGSLNPHAHRQRERTLEEVLEDRPIAGPLTRLQCTPIGEGGAAVIVASGRGIRELGIDEGRAVRVLSSAQRSEELYGTKSFDAELTRATAAQALGDARIAPGLLDIVEVHDAFSVEELQYIEAIGLSGEHRAAADLMAGEFNIGGRVSVSPSGGLLAMGHPVGPTGIGQVAEVTLQLRGEAGPRQHGGARTGLAHMVGVGAVCVVHVLARS